MSKPRYLSSCRHADEPALMINPASSSNDLFDEAAIRSEALRELAFFIRCLGEGGVDDSLGRRDIVAIGLAVHLMASDIDDLYQSAHYRQAEEHRAALEAHKASVPAPKKGGAAA